RTLRCDTTNAHQGRKSHRYPDIGRTFLESGPEVAYQRLEQFLRGRIELGELQIDDVALAAQQFVEMCKAGIFQRTMFELGEGADDEECERVARAAVRTFLRAFGSSAILIESTRRSVSPEP
ncbi:MAG: TetR/AcrR family transcriptional regulator C-terminal domain-containing protein, partial [Myxococcota bacterium]